MATQTNMIKKPYHPVVLKILHEQKARIVLDAPCGDGWLGSELARIGSELQIDGLGLWEFPDNIPIYRLVQEHDLDEPLPDMQRTYDAVVCGEAIHLLTNPGLALSGFHNVLRPGGTVIISTPNTWHARSRGQFLLRGFHSGFTAMYGKKRGDYVTHFPFSFPQLHLMLSHCGFRNIRLHEVDEPKPKRAIERLIGWPSQIYCRRKAAAARTADERDYWQQTASMQSLYGRWLVVSAER